MLDPENPKLVLPNLTPAVNRAVEAAIDLAAGSGAAGVQPTHLLQGLLAEEEGRAAALLSNAGLSLALVNEALTKPAYSKDTASTQERTSPDFSEAGEIVEYAAEIAVDLTGDRTVASEHLLMALLRRSEPVRQQLESLGLDFGRFEARLTAAVAAPLQLDEPLRLSDPTEQIDTIRIVDASANRAREALRVIEDYCRFSLDDKFLSRELKSLRHDLAQVLRSLPTDSLLGARETLRDVGTSLSTGREQERHNLSGVAQTNLKRLQEALRSLEEFGKLHSRELGQAFERLRYRSYTLERAILLGTTARQRLADARVYVLVTGSLCTASLDWIVQEAIAGGADMIQLREKNLTDRALLERARQVREWTQKTGALLIVNDRPDIARLVEADGVHIGQEELPVKEVRRINGPDMLVGVSTHNLEQVRQAVLDGASYIGVGPTFASATKSFPEFPGLEFVRRAAEETSLPTFAIGGINLETIGAAVAAGAQRVAVSQAICQAEDPRAVAAALRRSLPPVARHLETKGTENES
jgi:thiamine-phosphate pyrophosphorylase